MNHLRQHWFEEDIKRLNNLHSFYVPLSRWTETEKEEIKNNLTYHSTKIEGLHLNYGDTLSYLKDKMIRQGARAKDISDLKNHQAILDIIFSTYDAVELTEGTIKQLHAELMQDPSQWDVIDPLQAGAGEYKRENNYVYRSGGDHIYLDYQLVPQAMESFVIKINDGIKNCNAHPIAIVAETHFDFLQIHPFTDGNGRVARLLSTLLLLKMNFPPLVIETTEKEKYFTALIQSETQPRREAIIHFFVKKMIFNLSHRVSKK